MLYLQTFGDLRLTDANGNSIRYPAKGLVMVAYLFTRKTRELSRHEVAEFLWTEAETELSGLNLRKLISRIRQIDESTNEPLLHIAASSIRLRTEAVAVDLQALDSAKPPLEQLRAISGLLQRDFMGSVKPATRSIDSWITGERRNHRLKLREALFGALPHAQSNDDFRAISGAGLYLLEKDPDDEEIREMLRRLPGASLADGDRSERVSGPKIHALPLSEQDKLVRLEPGKSSPSVLPRVVLLPPIPQGHVAGLAIANALIEDVTIELCALRNISIVAPHTAEQIRRDSDKAQVVARHSISYLLETRLSVEGLYAQLIYFPTDEVIWATRFTMTSDALPTQRRLIAQRLTSSLVQELAKNEQARLNIEADPQAYHSYLVGASLVGKLTLPHIRRARTAFKEALRHNPNFSPAFAALARTYTSEWLVTAQGNEELLRLAETNAVKAIEGDSEFAGGHRELGVAKLYLGDVDHSVSALSLAEELSPHFADVIYSHADTLVHASRPDEALSKITRAISLNPISPDAYFWCAAGASYFLEQYEDAIGYVELMKDKAPAHRIAAASCAMMGDRKRAQFYRQRAAMLNPVFDVEKWLSVVPFKEQWQKDLYREGLLKAGF
ncbi:peptide antibiotic resistance protein (plasmid) [Rhizobium sullae]|uniref:Peptide antibiotic resistance protein n=1 Tax=Rhizobium sullae TaxID=50338 RepID=A0A2N0DEQ3_RHISU|nr:peptide antibiotic resistance protein [Rhizobium sullae]PKA44583.1 peptide antibiotic resistance protein [Rhizobium sullae]UWU17906.1 peptide antibiotic resistance protein [Rhizobium sullae]